MFPAGPQAAALHRSTNRTHKPEMAEHASSAAVAWCSPYGFQTLVKGTLLYVSRRKEDPERVLWIMTGASEEWELVEIECWGRVMHGPASQPGGSQAKVESPGDPSDGKLIDGDGSRTKNKHRSKTPICHGCGESGHILRNCNKSKQGGGAGGQGEGETGPGPERN